MGGGYDMSLPRMRGLSEAVKELKEQDPKTALTEHALRIMVKSGVLPCIRAGNKYLINMAVLERYLSGCNDAI